MHLGAWELESMLTVTNHRPPNVITDCTELFVQVLKAGT